MISFVTTKGRKVNQALIKTILTLFETQVFWRDFGKASVIGEKWDPLDGGK